MMGQLAHDNNHVPVISTVGAGSARPMETNQKTTIIKCNYEKHNNENQLLEAGEWQ